MAEAESPLALLARMGADARAAQIVDPPGGPITGGGVSLAHDLTLHLIGRLYGEAPRDEVARLIEYDRAFAANRHALGVVVGSGSSSGGLPPGVRTGDNAGFLITPEMPA